MNGFCIAPVYIRSTTGVSHDNDLLGRLLCSSKIFENEMMIWLISICFIQTLEEIRWMTCTFHHWASSLLTNTAALLSLLAREWHISLEKFKRLGAKCPTETAWICEWGFERCDSSQQDDFTCLTGVSNYSSSCFSVLDWADTTREQSPEMLRQPRQSASWDEQWMCNYERWSGVCRLKR